MGGCPISHMMIFDGNDIELLIVGLWRKWERKKTSVGD